MSSKHGRQRQSLNVVYIALATDHVSVNYKTSGIGKGLCELNSKTLQEITDKDENVKNPDFNHLYIIEMVRKIQYYLLLLYSIIIYSISIVAG
jgi:hypothetical protein